MGVLEDVAQMRDQGMSEQEIVNTLQQKGVHPKQIYDALDQVKIKNAVSEKEYPPEQEKAPQPSLPEAPEINGEEYYPPQQSAPGTYAPEQKEYYPQPNYTGYEGYETPGISDTDTMIEVADQVFSEKIQKLQKQIDKTEEFENLAQVKIDNIENRLKKIETSIDKLQIAILEKIGSYGRGIENIKKEMGMMQDSFRKLVPSLAHKRSGPAKSTTKTKKTRKKKTMKKK